MSKQRRAAAAAGLCRAFRERAPRGPSALERRRQLLPASPSCFSISASACGRRCVAGSPRSTASSSRSTLSVGLPCAARIFDLQPEDADPPRPLRHQRQRALDLALGERRLLVLEEHARQPGRRVVVVGQFLLARREQRLGLLVLVQLQVAIGPVRIEGGRGLHVGGARGRLLEELLAQAQSRLGRSGLARIPLQLGQRGLRVAAIIDREGRCAIVGHGGEARGGAREQLARAGGQLGVDRVRAGGRARRRARSRCVRSRGARTRGARGRRSGGSRSALPCALGVHVLLGDRLRAPGHGGGEVRAHRAHRHRVERHHTQPHALGSAGRARAREAPASRSSRSARAGLPAGVSAAALR